MRPLFDNPSAKVYRLDIMAGKIHDYANEVYNDILYQMYTIRAYLGVSVVNVDLIATDLVCHTNKVGEKGYWFSLGINEEILEGATIYQGYGAVNGFTLPSPTKPIDWETDEGKEEDNLVSLWAKVEDKNLELIADNDVVNETTNYGIFYIDVQKAKANNDRAYVIVEKDGVHIHYEISVSNVSLKQKEETLEPMRWNMVSVHEVKNNYLFGIDLSDTNGNPLPDSLFVHYLNSATQYIQNLLDIVIEETPFKEKHDYIRNDYQNWGFIQLSHNPVKEVKGIRLMYGHRPSIEIPLDWVQLDKLSGQITLFPQSGSANSLIIGQTGMLFGFQSQWDYAPMLWEVDYVAGIDENDPNMPLDLLQEAINKRASMGILNVWGRDLQLDNVA